jgi:hypothetical protein
MLAYLRFNILSDIILEQKGKANVNRVIDVDIQSRETTVTAIGRVRGLDVLHNYYILGYAKI